MAEELNKEDTKKEEGGDKKIVAYKLLAELGDNEAGEVIHLPEEVGDELVKAGIAEAATEEDMGGEGEEVEEEDVAEQPMVANAVSRLSKKVEKAVADSVAKTISKVRPAAIPAVPTLPAEVKSQDSLYKTPAALVRGIVKAMYGNDTTEKNKVMAYQEKAAAAWSKKLGVQVKAPLGINEGTNSQGGYLVNPQFSDDVYTIPHNQLDLAEQCEKIDAKSNTFNQRYVNESALSNGSIFGGLNMVATAEGASFTSSLPAWSNVAFTLQKLALFNYYTVEVLQDASYPIESELNEMATKVFLYGVNTQIIQGTTLEGALNAPSLVTVPKSGNDTAWSTTESTNLTYADIASIWSSVYPDCQVSPKGMWLFHPSLTNPMVQMTYTFSGSNPAWGLQYDAQNGLAGGGPMTPYRLFGKPAYPSWACSAPGNAGDILYIDFATFRNYQKPFRVEVSKEFQFGSDQIAVRYVARLDARSVMRNKVTGVNGTQQFSNIVTRAATGT